MHHTVADGHRGSSPRAAIEAYLDQLLDEGRDLIALLDSLDDAGVELEPSFGGPCYYNTREVDLEADDADLEGTGDEEPSLGSIESHPSIWGHTGWSRSVDQTYWASSAWSGDREEDTGNDEPSVGFDEPELDDADDEPEMTDEPALGWTDTEAALGSYPSVGAAIINTI